MHVIVISSYEGLAATEIVVTESCPWISPIPRYDVEVARGGLGWGSGNKEQEDRRRCPYR
jgi:hypothetical protein